MKYWVEQYKGTYTICCKRDDWSDEDIGQAYGGIIATGTFEDGTVASTVGTGKATAYKMAAADELCDALENMVHCFGGDKFHSGVIGEAKLALAKAKGE